MGEAIGQACGRSRCSRRRPGEAMWWWTPRACARCSASRAPDPFRRRGASHAGAMSGGACASCTSSPPSPAGAPRRTCWSCCRARRRGGTRWSWPTSRTRRWCRTSPRWWASPSPLEMEDLASAALWGACGGWSRRSSRTSCTPTCSRRTATGPWWGASARRGPPWPPSTTTSRPSSAPGWPACTESSPAWTTHHRLLDHVGRYMVQDRRRGERCVVPCGSTSTGPGPLAAQAQGAPRPRPAPGGPSCSASPASTPRRGTPT